MHTSRASLDHCFHNFKNIQWSPKARFRVGDDGRDPVDIARALTMLDLISAL